MNDMCAAALTAAITDLAVAIRAWGEVISYHARSGAPQPPPPQPCNPAEPPPPQPAEPPSYDEVKAAVLGLIKARGRDAALAVLGANKAKTAKDIVPEQREAFIAACFAAMDA